MASTPSPSVLFHLEVTSKKEACYVPPPEEALSTLHLSTATLGADAKKDARVFVKARVNEEEEAVLCCLREGLLETCQLGIEFGGYTEFVVEGPGTVHLAGYMYGLGMEEEEDDSDYDMFDGDDDYEMDDEEEEEFLKMQLARFQGAGVPMLDEEEGDDDSEDGSEDDSEELIGGGEGSESSEGESEEEEEAREPNVKIKEISDEEAARIKQSRKKKLAKEESESESEESEDDDELEENEEAKKLAAAMKNAETRNEKKAATKKRAAQTPPAKTPPPKKATTPGATPPQSNGASKTSTPSKKGGDEKKTTPGSAGKQKTRRYPSGLELTDTKMGRPDGKQAKSGRVVAMRYVGKLTNGKVFDKNVSGKPFEFRLGIGDVIKGWDVGIVGMREGDKRTLSVPPSLGYGARGIPGTIPRDATLIFDVELLKVK